MDRFSSESFTFYPAMEKALELVSCLYGLLVLLSLAMVVFLSQFPSFFGSGVEGLSISTLPLPIPLMVGLVVYEAMRAVVSKRRQMRRQDQWPRVH